MLFKGIYSYRMCANVCMHACLCISCMHGACRDQERAANPLGLDLQMVVSCHVGAGDPSESFGRAASANKC